SKVQILSLRPKNPDETHALAKPELERARSCFVFLCRLRRWRGMRSQTKFPRFCSCYVHAATIEAVDVRRSQLSDACRRGPCRRAHCCGRRDAVVWMMIAPEAMRGVAVQMRARRDR